MNIDAKFEKISKYVDDEGVIIPTRKTAESAGYDFCAAEDTVIPAYEDHINANFANALAGDIKKKFNSFEDWQASLPYTLDDIAKITKEFGAKVTLVPTGIKCKIPKGWFLQLSARSSLPLKHWLVVANGVGIIDADYYDNPDNEGHIYFQIINFMPVPIVIKKGEPFGQGILMQYGVAEGDNTTTERVGGLGSTTA